MEKLKEALKTALIHAQSLTKTLPADMADLDTSIFDAALKPVMRVLQAIHEDCEKGINETLTIDEDILRTFQDIIEEQVDIDYTQEAYQENER